MGQYALFMREINEFLATCADTGKAPSFAQKIIGLIETDLGLGLITEAARDREGESRPYHEKAVGRTALRR